MTTSDKHLTQFTQEIFALLKPALPKDHNSIFEVDTDRHNYFFKAILTHHNTTVQRIARISRVGLDDKIQVVLEEALYAPFCVMKVETFEMSDLEPYVIAFRFRHIRDFFLKPIDPQKVVPITLVHKAEEITKQWLSGTATKVTPYLDSDECGDQWRFKIVSESYPDMVFCQHLNPDTADGPLYATIVRAYFEGKRDGRIEAAVHIAEKAALTAFLNTLTGIGVSANDLPEKVRRLMRSTTLIDQLR